MHPPIAAALAVPLLAVALAAGCAGLPAADRPSRLPTEPAGSGSTIASPAASVTPATSPVPSPSTEAQRVEQAVRDYYAAANAAILDGDFAGLIAKSTPGCGCRKLVETIKKLRMEGRVDGGLFSLRSASATLVSSDIARADVVVDAAAGNVLQ